MDYLSDGMSEELIHKLTRVPGFRVPARTSSFAYKGRNVNVRDIARDLNVAAVIEGSVRAAGACIRVTAQVIDARSGYHVWSQTYDRQLADIFVLQDELVVRHVNNGTCTIRIPGVDRGIRHATDRTELEQARPPDRG